MLFPTAIPLLDDYKDKPGYKGVTRFSDHKKMVRLTEAAAKYDMNVHVHSIGDASTKAWIDAFAEIEKAKCLATYVDGELVYKA